MTQMKFTRPEPTLFTVTELNTAIQRLVTPVFDDIRVSGELSGFKIWESSGHAYFSIKDRGGLVRCAMWKGTVRFLKFRPRDGMAVVLRGSIEFRLDRGEYQFIATSMEQQGVGALQEAFEALKRRLAEEGLFAPERKRPLPRYPRRIGIVTSPQGAVIRDMLTVLERRWPGLHIRLYPTPVQGEAALAGICEGLLHFAESGWPDVIIVGRGGGSIEDLWTFNEEAVARTIAEMPMPVVSAVGHETDFTIADFVADLRAPTPSAAAEMIVRDREEVLREIGERARRAYRMMVLTLSRAETALERLGVEKATRLMERRLGRAGQRLDETAQRLRACDPRMRLARDKERLQAAGRRLEQALAARLLASKERLRTASPDWGALARRRLDACGLKLAPLEARLEALSPLSVLGRGYSIVRTEAGRVVRAAADAPPGTELELLLKQDRLKAVAR